MAKIFGLDLRDIVALPRHLRVDVGSLLPQAARAKSMKSRRSSKKSKTSTSTRLSEAEESQVQRRSISARDANDVDDNNKGAGSNVMKIVDTLHLNRFSVLRRRRALSAIDFDLQTSE